jgi:hypothetical protein
MVINKNKIFCVCKYESPNFDKSFLSFIKNIWIKIKKINKIISIILYILLLIKGKFEYAISSVHFIVLNIGIVNESKQ